jgi:hypothetical protein
MRKIMFLCFMGSLVFGEQPVIIPGNKVDIEIKVSVSFDTTTSLFTFNYKLKSLPTSEQNLWDFRIPLKDTSYKSKITEVSGPPPDWWNDIGEDALYKFGYWIPWGPLDSLSFLRPGDSLSGFSFKTTLFPDVGDAYVEGYHPAPSFPEGHVPPIIEGYENLTPYGPGKVYKTVVLGKEPSMGSSNGNYPDSAFRDLRHKLAECEFEGWISNKIYWDLRRVIDRAWDFIKDGRLEQSKRTLTHLLRTLERLKEEQKIKDEAFYVMFYRTKYVRDNLWYKPPGK